MSAFNSRQHQSLLQIETFSSSFSMGCGEELIAKPGKKTTDKRQVRFQNTVYVRPIRHVDTISQDEKQCTWFCKQDYVQMKEDFSRTVRMMAIGLFECDNDVQCSRGLEYHTCAGALQRRETKRITLNAVLDEQDRQHKLQLFDENLLGEMYAKENEHSRQAALEMGLHDQQEVRSQGEYRSDDDTDSSFSSDDEMDYCDIYLSRSTMTAPTRKITVMSRDE